MFRPLQAIGWQRVAFLFSVNLAVFLFLIGARLDLTALPLNLLGLNAFLALVSAVIATAILEMLIRVVIWIFRRRRRPLVWLTIWVLVRAARETSPSILASGIMSKEGNLYVSLPRNPNDFVVQGDSFLAIRLQDRQSLGVVSVVDIEQDSYLCELSDRLDATEFWTGLEFRMMRDYSPPAGVEFARHIGQLDIDFVQRLIRSWGG